MLSESRERMLTVALPVLTAVVFLSCWQLVAKSWQILAVILPAPSDILRELGAVWNDLLYQAWFTGSESVVACVMSAALGAGTAAMLASSPVLREMLYPNLVLFQLIPKIALAPLFVIVLGIGIESRVALVAITVFFLVLNSTLDGVRNVDRDLVRTLTLMGATRTEVIGKVLVPATLPWIFTGMRISVRYAFTNTLLAELIASNSGIGFMIEYYSGIFDATGTYAAILVLVIMSVGITELLTQVETMMSRGRGR
jgi:NitT/TauT family transport system permease protein